MYFAQPQIHGGIYFAVLVPVAHVLAGSSRDTTINCPRHVLFVATSLVLILVLLVPLAVSLWFTVRGLSITVSTVVSLTSLLVLKVAFPITPTGINSPRLAVTFSDLVLLLLLVLTLAFPMGNKGPITLFAMLPLTRLFVFALVLRIASARINSISLAVAVSGVVVLRALALMLALPMPALPMLVLSITVLKALALTSLLMLMLAFSIAPT